MLNIITHQGEANQNQMKKEHPYEIILIPTRWLTSKQELVLVRTCSEVGGGMQNGAGALEESGSISTCSTHSCYMTQQLHSYVHTSKNWKQAFKESLHMNVYSSTIHSYSKMEKPKCPSKMHG